MSVRNWLNERLRYEAAETFLEKKEVPVHRYAVSYYTGGITLFFFLIQVFTGLLLLMYYRPTSDAAFESVRLIISKVRFGWLIRSVHVWSGNGMVAAGILHLLAPFFRGASRQSRPPAAPAGSPAAPPAPPSGAEPRDEPAHLGPRHGFGAVVPRVHAAP